jgi:hypothetical protein
MVVAAFRFSGEYSGIQNGLDLGSASSEQTVQLGSVTPVELNTLVISACHITVGQGAISITSGFEIITQVETSNIAHCAIAYKVARTAGALDPTWTVSASVAVCGTNAVFNR